MIMNEREKLGQSGESKACAYLKNCGYRIIERNFRCRMGEIDIIASEGRKLCFVEVKTRCSIAFGLPREAVGRAKQRKLRKAAGYYMMLHGEYGDYILRMDVIEILYFNSKTYVNHIKNAFGEGA